MVRLPINATSTASAPPPIHLPKAIHLSRTIATTMT
jgi:hypothetical protein